MPSLCTGRRCPQYIGRRTGVLVKATRPRLRIEDGPDDGDHDANESDENISPDADKSELHFTLKKRRTEDGNNNDNSSNNRGDSRRSRNRASGNNQDSQNGRGGDSNPDGARFPGSRDDRPSFRGKAGGGRRFNKEGDGKGFQNNNSPGDSNVGGNTDANRGGGDNRGGGNNNGGAGNERGGSDNGGRGGSGGGGGGGGQGGEGEGEGGGDPANDRTSSDSSSDSATTSLPPSTSVTSTVEAITTTTTPLVESTSTPSPEPTTPPPGPTTITSVPQETLLPILTPLPALEDPSLTAPAISTTLVPPVTSGLDNTLDTTQGSTSLISPTTVVGSSAAAPTETAPAIDLGDANGGRNNNGNDGSGDVNNNNNNNNAPIATQEKGLNPTSERILVAAGAIGGFIMLCFVGWILYRSMKKSKQSDGGGNNKSWLSSLFPWRGKPSMSGVEVFHSSYQPKEPLPVYDVGNNNSMEAVGYYNQEKLYAGGPQGMYPSTTAPQLGRMIWQTPEGQSIPTANPLYQCPQSDGQTFDSTNPNSTLRSRMPDPYYNQSEFARQPSDAYNPAQRQVYRASEISSLSSGFGDGDIIMPPPNTMPKPVAAQLINADSNNRPFSWMSRTGTEQKRDTVSTTISERPPRFRSINSWVDQQKERIGRADSRAREREEVPVVPPIPALTGVTPQNP